MNKPKILKAEFLLTYKCPRRCKICKVVDQGKKIKEPKFDIIKWRRAIKISYIDLNSDFICFYGAEPLTIGIENLGKLIEEANKYRKKGKGYSIISNGLLMDDKKIDYLVSKGLDSFSCSIDTLTKETYDYDSLIKSRKGLEVLNKFKKKGVRDTCGIITVTKKNIKEVPNIAKQLIKQGHYVNIDLIHYDKQHGNDTFSSSIDKMKDIVFRPEDISILTKVADELIKIKKQTNMIFPPEEYFEMWKDKNYSVYLNWKCGSEPQPHSITVRPDFHIQNCDCYPGKRVKKYTIFNLPKNWKQFSNDYFKDVAECPGCFWSTHYMATEISKNYNKNKVKQYQHKIK